MDETSHGGVVLTDDDGGAPCLVLHGALGPEHAVDVLEAATALAARAADATVCCRFVERLDLATLQVLVALRAAQDGQGKRLVLDEVPEAVARALGDVGLGALLGTSR